MDPLSAHTRLPRDLARAAQRFLDLVRNPNTDASILSLRRSMTREKRIALERAQSETAEGSETLEVIMEALFRQLVTTKIQMAARVGLAVALALEVYDEHASGVSVSSLSRPMREGMTEPCVALARQSASPMAKLAAEIEACRLAWRHNHEFLSWLAFRRDEAKYRARDRLARVHAFKVESRILASRAGVIRALGQPLTVALEAHDRFMLDNRWHLDLGPAEELEQIAWTLLSYQPPIHVEVEMARHRFDRAYAQGSSGEELDELRDRMAEMLAIQLALALHVSPDLGALQHDMAA